MFWNFKACFSHGLVKAPSHAGRTRCGRVRIHDLKYDGDASGRGGELRLFSDRLQDAVAPGEVNIAGIQREPDAAGNAVDRAGNTSQMPTVATVSREPAARAALSTARMISAAAHSASLRSGISTPPAWPPGSFDHDFQARRGRDALDDAQRQTCAFQQRTLLDMQLDESAVAAAFEPHRFETAFHSRLRENVLQPLACAVLQSPRVFRRERSGHHAAAEAADAEARRLFRQ